MSTNLELLILVLLVIVPLKALPWLLLAYCAFRGH